MSTPTKSTRIASLDQFRGYSVAGMFVVNFLGGLAITHHLLRHNNTHFSWADSIMPSFIFACGFSYRMSFLKRLSALSVARVRGKFVARSLALILLSLMAFGFNESFDSWSEMSGENAGRFVAELVKANMWEVLAIIGATQILLLPVVATGVWARVLTFGLFAVAHVLISWSFNYEFVYGRPNWMDAYFGAAGKRAWDGGIFGLIAWAEIMLAGTLAFDIVHRYSSGKAAAGLFAAGIPLMLLGYGLSCATRLYDVAEDARGSVVQKTQSPVFPPFAAAAGRDWRTLLAEPPFVPPPSFDQRQANYWMMDKRIVSQSFTIFSSGYSMTLYAVFVLLCDVGRWSSRLFKTFGENPLAAYIIHHFVAHSILDIVPKDSPLAWSVLGLLVSFGITYVFVRFLERRQLYLRL